MKKFNVEVIQAYIDRNGGDSGSCPIWQAIQVFPELKDFQVGADFLWKLTQPGVKVLLPLNASCFSKDAWDAAKMGYSAAKARLKPFSFVLEVPEEYLAK